MDMRKRIQRSIEYPHLCLRFDPRLIDDLVSLIAEVLENPHPVIRIAGNEMPAHTVQERFTRINAHHIEYVLGCMEDNAAPVKNIKAYLLAALFNAPATMDSFYQAQQNEWRGSG